MQVFIVFQGDAVEDYIIAVYDTLAAAQALVDVDPVHRRIEGWTVEGGGR